MGNNEEKLLNYLKRATADLRDARRKLSEAEERQHAPIAIVGMACRFPGGVTSPEQLWQLVAAGDDGVTGFPADRGWDTEGLYDPEPGKPGTTYVREGGFLHDCADFDPAFFGISPREALAMDPQQRLVLETSWEAFERAGIDPHAVRGTQTGVFAGVMYHDYGSWVREIPDELAGYLGNGTSGSILSGRIAYTLGLEGPAMTVDTACSSSLVALHSAMQALRRGECSLALAGGVTVMSTPDTFVEFSLQQGLAADGRCKPFAAAADGTGWGEGVGMLLLERLSDARRNGHEVLGVVRGSAVNQDGASSGMTVPNGPSQQRVIRAALADAGIEASGVDAVEAHGTGTRLGDPIEAQALLATYGKERREPLWLGSVKSNIGHTQAAAGVASVIKMVMAMRHGVLPRTLHVDAPSPHVDWSQGPVELLTEARPWESGERPRRAGVSSFGLSGTNAHVILEQSPADEPADEPDGAPEVGSAGPAAVPWPVSGASDGALRGQAARLLSLLDDTDGNAAEAPTPDLLGIGHSLLRGRATFDRRAVVVGTDAEQLRAGLTALVDDDMPVRVASTTGGKLALVFPGQGAQWPGMGARLAAESPAFARRLDECATALAPFVDWSLIDVIHGADGAPSLERVDVVQPASFAVMVSLAALWESFGVRPDAVVGHSQGEIAAAVVSGALTLEDGARVVALRSQAIARTLAGAGGMMSVRLPVAELEPRLRPGVSIAAVNGPGSVAVSGDPAGLDALYEELTADDVRVRRIAVDYASHSPQVELLRDELLDVLAPVAPRTAEIPFYSTVTAGWLDTTAMDAGYWYRNLRRRVLFADAVEALGADGFRTFVESSAHPVLIPGISDSLDAGERDGTVSGTLRRDEGGLDRFLRSAGDLWAAGVDIDWTTAFPGDVRRVDLPTYAFDRQRYWLDESAVVGDVASAGLISTGHALLGAAFQRADGQGMTFTGRVGLGTHPWLGDHVVEGRTLFPGTGFVELAIRAGDEVGHPSLEELTLAAPLILPAKGSVVVQVHIDAPADGASDRRDVAIYSRSEDAPADLPWTRHATGTLGAAHHRPDFDLTQWPPERAEPFDVTGGYERLADAGLAYGPAFRGLRTAWLRGPEVFAEVALPSGAREQSGRYGIHPALLDAALHAIGLGGDGDGDVSRGGAELPFAWQDVELYATEATSLRVHVRPTTPGTVAIEVADATGTPVASIGSLALRPVTAEQLASGANATRDALFRVEWQETAAHVEPEARHWTVIAPADTERAHGVAPLADVLVGAGTADSLDDVTDAEAASGVVVLTPHRSGTDPLAVHAAVAQMLTDLQNWLSQERFTDGTLLVVTRGATDGTDLAGAAVWGLLRTAQQENPGRFVLVDLSEHDAPDTSTDLARLLPLAPALGEPEIAVRAGALQVPRLVRAYESPATPARDWDPEGTVVVTGASGTLASTVVRHLVAERGVRHLLLLSRSGATVTDLGDATVTALACDVTDRTALAAALGSVPAEHPVTAVIHTAGVLDDGTVESLTPDRLATVLRPKVDAAWHLHELTADLDLTHFVLFSSFAGLAGSAGQANYSAANAYLDALALHRGAAGLPAHALAWGFWDSASGMTGHLDAADRARISRSGISPLSTDEGLELFDAAVSHPEAVLAPARLDLPQLRKQGAESQALFRVLVPTTRRGVAGAGAAADVDSGQGALLALPEAEREQRLLDLVRGQAAAVLGHGSAAAIEPNRAFREFGFDSLTAVELRNRLNSATRLRLPATLVFDYPSPLALARFLHGELAGRHAAPSGGTGPASTASTATTTDEPIAIVGMSCRYPGDIASPEDLWRLVSGGVDAISDFPRDRGWDVEGVYDPEPGVEGKSYVREGGFLTGAADFDAGFFGISPREALTMDPQERLLLELSWEAFERAAIAPDAVRGSQTGVFAGLMHHDYAASSSGGSLVSGRISYTFGLEGPAITVDTACSSSLVALHWAARSLRAGECSLALAGGVAVMSTPEMFVDFSQQRGLAPDGRCKSFSAAADGAAWSEGAGMLLLERLSDARRNGHRVLGVVRGSAVNQDGASNGFAAPNGPSQQRVILAALANAGLAAADVDVVEGHGTGTSLGDPIEAQALLATYGQNRETPLMLGSIKSNIGHAQAAAGVAGVIKMITAMHNEVVPRTLHVADPSDQVDWSTGAVELLTEDRAWPEVDRPWRAGVSSFGISGTNAHVIVEQAPPEDRPSQDAPDSARPESPAEATVIPLVLSGRSVQGVRDQARNISTLLDSGVAARDVAYSLATARGALDHRSVAVGRDADELRAALAKIASGGTPLRMAPGGGLGFVFSGQGSQWVGMGRGLYEVFPVFAGALDEVLDALDVLGGDVRSVMWAEAESAEALSLSQTGMTQPALFAVEVALFRLLESWGVRPDVVGGHSVGEIAAAYVAGVLSLSDAAVLVSARGRLMQALPGGGAMVAVQATEEEIAPLLREGVSVAAVNSPNSVVVSGVEEVVVAVAEHFTALGRKTSRLKVSHAFHSSLMVPMLEDFRAVVAGLELREPKIPLATAGDVRSVDFWVSHVRDTVRFVDVVRRMETAGVSTFMEIGPDAVLSAMGPECVTGEDTAFIPVMRRHRDEPRTALDGLGRAWSRGVPVDWSATVPGGLPVDLPTYPFEHRRYWLEPSIGAGISGGSGQDTTDHPILAAALDQLDSDGVTLTGRLSLGSHPWLAEHRVHDTILLPGTALVELVLHAGAYVECPAIDELTLYAPLVVPDDGDVRLRVTVGERSETGRRSVSVHGRATGEEWTEYAGGTLTEELPAPVSLTQWPPPGATPLDVGTAYERLSDAGIDYGPVFRGLRAAWQQGADVFAEVALPEGTDADGFALHPALFDAALHAGAFHGADGLPFAWSGVAVHRTGASDLRIRLTARGENGVALTVADADGAPVATVESLATRPASAAALTTGADRSLHRPLWTERSGTTPFDGTMAVVTDLADLTAETPDVVVLRVESADGDGTVPSAARATAVQVLTALQNWLSDERFTAAQLAVLTRDAAPATAGPDLSQAPVWGLVRAARAEHPGRFLLLDVPDAADISDQTLRAALGCGEPEVRIEDGTLLVPRWTRTKATDAPRTDHGMPGSVLVTGGTGGLGAAVARHLVETHGVRDLVLVSRRGAEAPGAEELRAELTAHGAEVALVAADVSDRDTVTALFAAHPVDGVIHAAGVLADGLVESLTPDQFDTVFRPKVDAAWNLHELGGDLSLFVLFSSATGAIDPAAQGNYAAANGFLDALAEHRNSRGLSATSLAWGFWDQEGMAAQLDAADRERIRRTGIAALSTEEGLALFDAAVATGAPALAPVRLDTGVLRSRDGELPVVLRDMIRRPARQSTAGTGLPFAVKLTSLPATEREAYVLGIVRAEVAAVLGHDSAADIEPRRAFTDFGFDSLTSVEFRNKVAAATGLRLPATLVFDHPTPRSLADHLLARAVESAPVHVATTATAADRDDPIVIVGMSCRYPGGVASPDDLWQLVSGGVDAISGFPTDRGWDLESLHGAAPGQSYTAEGGFLTGAADFDADFFGISPREALAMDPQQRLLLETAWESFEHAGIDPDSLHGTDTGIFAGVMYRDYGSTLTTVPDDLLGYFGNGTLNSVVTGRVAYSLGLEGPAVTVDTACSSSLVALHWAAQSLRAGECSLALAGGVTVMSTPGTFVEFSRQNGLASDGRCKPFSTDADGTGWSEGVGLVVLERLSDARRNGHQVLATVRGSAINQDGASNGLTAPNGPSQQRVIRSALANAGLAAADIDVVEAHGTGTKLGDPIEAQALLATYGQNRETPLLLGSIKSNLGHTQAAAGVAGVIKMVQAMRHGQAPKSLHVAAPSDQVDWSEGAVELLSEARELPAVDRPWRAGVSSFGISGTNAHVILEQAPDAEPLVPEPTATESPLVPTVPLVLSGKTERAVQDQAGRLLATIDSAPAVDVAHALATTRAALQHRATVTGGTRDELRAALGALAHGGPATDVVRGTVSGGGLGCLFSGQGSQWVGMGRGLYETFPAFAAALDSVCALLDKELPRPLTDVMWADPESPDSPEAALLNQTGYTQPALFAIEVALFRLLESWGMRPDAVGGHSIGEIAAAHVAGVLSLPDAAALVAARGRLMQALPAGGAMVAIQATEEEVAPLLSETVSLGAVNAPGSVVVSGVEDAVVAVAEHFTALGRKTSRLKVSHAFHSSLMVPMLDEFREVVAGLELREPRIPFATSGDVRSVEFWVDHVRQAVRFMDVVRTMEADGVTTFAEIGPDAVLTAMGPACATGQDVTFVPLMRRDRDEIRTALKGVGQAWTRGVPVDWTALLPSARRVDLPTYAFQHSRYWLEAAPHMGDLAGAGQEAADHPMLAAVVPSPDTDTVTLTGRLSARDLPWLADHAVHGVLMVPGTALVELAMRAGREVHAGAVEELTLESPLLVPEAGATALRVDVAEPDGTGRRRIRLHSRPDGGAWQRHATGYVNATVAGPDPAGVDLVAWPPPGAEGLEVNGAYDELADRGYAYGPAFQGLRAAWRRNDETFAEVELPEHTDPSGYGIHPALLDACWHALLLGARDERPVLPFAWTGVALHTDTGTHPISRVRVRIAPSGPDTTTMTVADPSGRLVATVTGLVARPVSAEQLSAGPRSLYRITPTPVSAPATAEADDRSWVVLGADTLGLGLPVHPDLASVPDPAPDVITHHCSVQEGPVPDAVRTATVDLLGLLSAWLAEPRLATTRLVLTLGDHLSQAPLAGLVRAAQAEHPGRITLVHLRTDDARLLTRAVTADEPELTLGDDTIEAPRLTRITDFTDFTDLNDAGDPAQAAIEGPVLITGGTGGLGAIVARHLVETHGVHELVLASRRGAGAPGADDLRAELTALGARVTLVACDAADRDALAAMLADHPVRSVVHAAGVVDNGVLASLTPERVAAVLRPKVDAAWNLHELTEDLSAFVLFSSSAGTLLGAGQANYATANVFLDALARHRHGLGLPAVSMGWGLWDTESGMAGELDEAGRQRMRRLGMPAIGTDEALGLFDAALGVTDAAVLPIRFDTAALRSRGDDLPAMLRALVPRPVRGTAAAAPVATATEDLAKLLAGMERADQDAYLSTLVRGHVAAVLGHPDAGTIDPGRALREMGFDSLAAVELRNLLSAATGLQLSATLVFDHPSVDALAQHLGDQLLDHGADPTALALAEVDRLAEALTRTDADRTSVTNRLEALLRQWRDAETDDGTSGQRDFESATDDELFAALDNELAD
ncbi:type I polyketide synthase [Streptomyces sp. NPDC050428]|uniref:type I polyketide synthase n=1 Tax=Streptomyces sp. NPDC050428 TaxID=3155757 RepID=UPI00343216E1